MKTCSCKRQSSSGPKYGREVVPIKYFLKPGKPGTDLYKTCLDCRTYQKKCRDGRKEKIKKVVEANNDDPNFKVCEYESHKRISVYPKEKIPKEMFLIYPNYPNYISNYCSDCRKYRRSIKLQSKTSKMNNVLEGQFYCNSCCQIKNIDIRATNLNGTKSKVCMSCQDYQKKYNKNKYVEMKKIYRQIQKEFIFEHQTCCQYCNCIFLRSKKDNGSPIM